MMGLLATWTVASGTPAQSEAVAGRLAQIAKAHIEMNGAKFWSSMARSARKYRFLQGSDRSAREKVPESPIEAEPLVP